MSVIHNINTHVYIRNGLVHQISLTVVWFLFDLHLKKGLFTGAVENVVTSNETTDEKSFLDLARMTNENEVDTTLTFLCCVVVQHHRLARTVG